MKMRDILQKLFEIEIGGEVNTNNFDDFRDNDFTPKQLTLFPNIPSEPTLPSKMEMMGRLGEFFITRKKESDTNSTYYLFDSGKPVAYIATIHPKTEFGSAYRGRLASDPELNGEGLRVVSIFLDSVVRGRGISLALYEWLLRNVCDYIFPDDTHTKGGVYIWKQLVRDPRFEVMIFNPEKIRLLSCSSRRSMVQRI